MHLRFKIVTFPDLPSFQEKPSVSYCYTCVAILLGFSVSCTEVFLCTHTGLQITCFSSLCSFSPFHFAAGSSNFFLTGH